MLNMQGFPAITWPSWLEKVPLTALVMAYTLHPIPLKMSLICCRQEVPNWSFHMKPPCICMIWWTGLPLRIPLRFRIATIVDCLRKKGFRSIPWKRSGIRWERPKLWPLTAVRFASTTQNAHYVTCCESGTRPMWTSWTIPWNGIYRKGRRTSRKLLRYAEQLRVSSLIRKYVEILLWTVPDKCFGEGTDAESTSCYIGTSGLCGIAWRWYCNFGGGFQECPYGSSMGAVPEAVSLRCHHLYWNKYSAKSTLWIQSG